MTTIKIGNKTLTISAQQERSLRHLKSRGFAAQRSEFWEGSPRHLKFELDISTSNGVHEVSKKYYQWVQDGSLIPAYADILKPTVMRLRVEKFFRENPRCNSAIIGNPRRINAILRKIDAQGNLNKRRAGWRHGLVTENTLRTNTIPGFDCGFIATPADMVGKLDPFRPGWNVQYLADGTQEFFDTSSEAVEWVQSWYDTKAGKTAAERIFTMASARKAAARKEPKKKATPRRGRMGSRNMP